MSRENSIRVVAFSTIVSRVTGLLRDMLVYAVFGTGGLNSAFIIAFTIPNLFRRFMGEGALTSALVPVLAHEQGKNGQQSAFELFNRVLARAAVALVGIILAGVALFQLVHFFELPERWGQAARLGPWVFPYLFFVCLSALVGAVLNLQKRFASTALAQIWVNVSMTLFLGGIGIWVSQDDFTRMLWMCGGVLFGGLLQLLLPAYALTREGWKPKLDFARDERLGEVWTLLGPGLLGATVAQIDTAISQLIAFSLNESATSVLFLSNRLMQLPLGVFAIAVTTVTFPLIARKAAEGDRAGFAVAYRESATLIQAVMIPAGVGLAVLAEPALVALFKWGSFDADSVRATVPILATYALGIPFFAGTTLTTRALHSLKETRAPVRWGLATLTTNLIMSLTLPGLMHFAHQPQALGLALSNVLSTALFAWGLRRELRARVGELSGAKTPTVRLLVCAGVMAAAVLPLVWLMPQDKLGRLVTLILGGGLGAGVYFVALYFASRESFNGVKRLVWR